MDSAEPLRLEQEKLVRDQLNPFLGAAIDSLHIDQDRISVCYDPTTLSKDALSKIISQAGGKIRAAQTERTPYFSQGRPRRQPLQA